MDAAPPEQLYFYPDPPSPSVFLDLPPTPPPPPAHHHDGDFDDMVLPYVARLLMEEDDDSFFYQYPDHPAVLQAQMPFAQILAGAASTTSTSSSGSGASSDSSSSPSWSCSADTDSDRSPTLASPSPDAAAADMVTSAFLKGMEEATKFLPTTTNNALLPLNRRRAAAAAGDARRATKLMLLQDPDAAADEASQMFDDMMLHDDRDICMKGVQVQVQSLATKQKSEKTPSRRGRRRSNPTTTAEAVDLHALLLRCAQAVATDDRGTAQDLLAQIRRHASATGDAAQRLAHCFAEGLEARLAGTGSRLYRSLMVRRTSAVDFLKAYQLFMAACCCKKVAFAFSNKTIHDAVAGRRRLHIVDYGLGYGFQWPGLLRGLAARDGGPPDVRITGIDLPQPGFRPAHQIHETGRRLSRCAREFGVPFRFRGIAAKRETVSPEDLLDIDVDDDDTAEKEVLVVSSLCHFRHLMDESTVVGRGSPRDEVLDNIRRMRPDVFIHGVMNGGYGTTYFPTRFREALFHYSAQFDLLDATVPRDSQERMLVERDIFGRAALNVIACEGADRVERPETYRQWQARNQRAGLRQLPLKPEVVKVVLDKVRDNYHRDFVVDEDQGWLVHSSTQGRCFKCLASDHRSSTCRNSVRCFGCRRYGHRLRDCKHPCGDRVAPASSATNQHVVQPASVTMVVLGDPCTRLDENSCVVPTSFDIEREAKEWESTALIPWAFSLPQGAGAREIELTILNELRLKLGEVAVSVHSPEAFLIKFENKKHCEAAYRRRRIERNGVVLCLRHYRSLEHALGARFFFRVRICLEEVPRHAWIPDVVERLLGRSCSVQYIETDLLHPTDTRSICLWAWSQNPSKIPKKIWLTFTNRAMGDASASWQVTEEYPEKWQFGARFQVLVHLDSMEDYAAAPTPLPGIAMPPFTPARHPFVWHWGKTDGEPGPDRVYEHPSPPRVEPSDGERGRGSGRGAGVEDGRRQERSRARPGELDDHPEFHLFRRYDGPDDDEDDGPGRHGHWRADGRTLGSAWSRGLGGSRARSRSPRRRDHGRTSRDGRVDHRRRQPHVPAGPEFKLPSSDELRTWDKEGLQKMFAIQAAALRADLGHLLEAQVQRTVDDSMAPQWLQQADNYIAKACQLADRLNIAAEPLLPGDQAWSGAATVPVSRALGRILSALPAHSNAGEGVPEMEVAAGVSESLAADSVVAGLPPVAADRETPRLVEATGPGSESTGLPCPEPGTFEPVPCGTLGPEGGCTLLPAPPTQEI
ncbi:hypothetical protein U9M48_000177 [Paspalum notatum var. saurae]|uniref:CCHC-type domain-containing protein n=1 Tax=Paspalum notatum var. saurae TaxID=547442 RepID=A0AAQ3PJW4_PASNO